MVANTTYRYKKTDHKAVTGQHRETLHVLGGLHLRHWCPQRECFNCGKAGHCSNAWPAAGNDKGSCVLRHTRSKTHAGSSQCAGVSCTNELYRVLVDTGCSQTIVSAEMASGQGSKDGRVACGIGETVLLLEVTDEQLKANVW